MEDIPQQLLSYARAGFNEINAVQGLLIALIATLILPSWKRLIVIVIGAVIAHILIDTLLPVINGGADLLLPPFLEATFWRYAFILFTGYLVVITFMSLVKRLVLKS